MKTNEIIIAVTNLDNSETSRIVSIIDRLEAESSEKKELKIKLHALKGYVENSLEIATAVHAAKNVDLAVDVSGTNGPASAVLCASGKPGSRIAQMGTTFTLNLGDPYEKNTKASELDEDDILVYQTLAALTGKKKLILEFIVKSGPLSAREAKKCGIIDSISEFKSKYLKPKGVKQSAPQNTEPSTQSVTSVGSQENATSGEAVVVARRRGRRKSSNA